MVMVTMLISPACFCDVLTLPYQPLVGHYRHPQGEALHVGAGSCRKCSGLPCGGHAASAALRHATHKRIATNSCSESMMDNPQGQELPVSTRQGGPGQLGSPQIRYYRLDDRLLRRGQLRPAGSARRQIAIGLL